jgi:DNA replication protein DnaC
MNKDIHRKIQRDYENKRQKSIEALNERRQRVYQALPQIETLDANIAECGLSYNKKILMGSVSSDALEELSSKLLELKREKHHLLLNNGFDEDTLVIKHSCGVCRDTGFVEKEEGNGFAKCRCYEQQLITIMISKSNLHDLENHNFDRFDLSLFADEVDEKKYVVHLSPRQSMQAILNKTKEFIENFDSYPHKGLLFVGPTGTGKTFLSHCIANELIKRGRTALYLSAPALFHTIQNYRTSSWDAQKTEDETYGYIMESELLIIDDLGIENITSARYAEFLTILNTRSSNDARKRCKTIISTNLGYKELMQLYTERVVSRIVGDFLSIKFVGEDLRRKDFSKR